MSPHFSAAAIAELVPFSDAVVALRNSFSGPLSHIDRVHARVADGGGLIIPGYPGRHTAGLLLLPEALP